MQHNFGGPMGPKVRANLEAGIPFEISLMDSSPELQLSEYPELCLLWPDGACLILHLEPADLRALKIFVAKVT